MCQEYIFLKKFWCHQHRQPRQTSPYSELLHCYMCWALSTRLTTAADAKMHHFLNSKTNTHVNLLHLFVESDCD